MTTETLINYEGAITQYHGTITLRGVMVKEGHLLPSEAFEAVMAELKAEVERRNTPVNNGYKCGTISVLIVHHFTK